MLAIWARKVNSTRREMGFAVDHFLLMTNPQIQSPISLPYAFYEDVLASGNIKLLLIFHQKSQAFIVKVRDIFRAFPLSLTLSPSNKEAVLSKPQQWQQCLADLLWIRSSESQAWQLLR